MPFMVRSSMSILFPTSPSKHLAQAFLLRDLSNLHVHQGTYIQRCTALFHQELQKMMPDADASLELVVSSELRRRMEGFGQSKRAAPRDRVAW